MVGVWWWLVSLLCSPMSSRAHLQLYRRDRRRKSLPQRVHSPTSRGAGLGAGGSMPSVFCHRASFSLQGRDGSPLVRYWATAGGLHVRSVCVCALLCLRGSMQQPLCSCWLCPDLSHKSHKPTYDSVSLLLSLHCSCSVKCLGTQSDVSDLRLEPKLGTQDGHRTSPRWQVGFPWALVPSSGQRALGAIVYVWLHTHWRGWQDVYKGQVRGQGPALTAAVPAAAPSCRG